MLAGIRLVRAVPQAFSQAAAMAAIKSQFPMLHFQGVKWPLLEDLMNCPAFLSFHQWAHEGNYAADGWSFKQ